MFFEIPESSQIQSNAVTAALIISIGVNLIQGLPAAFKWWFDRRDTQKLTIHKYKIDEFELLSKMITAVSDQLDKTRAECEKQTGTIEKKDEKIRELKEWQETFEEKSGDARAQIHDLSQVFREVGKLLKELGADPELIETIKDAENRMNSVRDCLKVSIHKTEA